MAFVYARSSGPLVLLQGRIIHFLSCSVTGALSSLHIFVNISVFSCQGELTDCCREAAFWRDGLDARNFSPLHQYWWNPLSTSRERVHRQMDQWLVGIFHNVSYFGFFPLILYRLDQQPDVACLGKFWLLRVPPFTVCCFCLSTLYLLHILVRRDGSDLGDAEPTWSWIGKRTAHVTRVSGH